MGHVALWNLLGKKKITNTYSVNKQCFPFIAGEIVLAKPDDNTMQSFFMTNVSLTRPPVLFMPQQSHDLRCCKLVNTVSNLGVRVFQLSEIDAVGTTIGSGKALS